jgi:hypothetical protein
VTSAQARRRALLPFKYMKQLHNFEIGSMKISACGG